VVSDVILDVVTVQIDFSIVTDAVVCTSPMDYITDFMIDTIMIDIMTMDTIIMDTMETDTMDTMMMTIGIKI